MALRTRRLPVRRRLPPRGRVRESARATAALGLALGLAGGCAHDVPSPPPPRPLDVRPVGTSKLDAMDCVAGPQGTLCTRPERPRAAPPDVDPAHRIEGGAVELRPAHRIVDQGRGRVACTYDPARDRMLCLTDLLPEDWSIVGTRLLSLDPHTFEVSEARVSETLHSSYLWGDLNLDGHPDFVAFTDMEEPAPESTVLLYLGTEDAAVFEPSNPFGITYPTRAGVLWDADGDGCEDVLVLGSKREDWDHSVFEYFGDTLFLGDCAGGFAAANGEAGLDAVPGFVGAGEATYQYGNFAVLSDLDADGCPDPLVGNYRAHPNVFLRSDCAGTFVRFAGDPDRASRTYYGHTLSLFPVDTGGTGLLDVYEFNLWHSDSRGEVTIPAHVLRARAPGTFEREALPYYLEAPFGAFVADLDSDGDAELFMATGYRWWDYPGYAALLAGDELLYRDTADWLDYREAPSVLDLDLDGDLDVAGDRQLLGNHTTSGHFVGAVLHLASPSGTLATLELSNGARRAFSLAADGRGQPANVLTVGLPEGVTATALVLSRGAGATWRFPLVGLPSDRYFDVYPR